MKKKLTALLAAMLLCLTLLPAQALAASDPDPADPPAVTETGEPETPEDGGIVCQTTGQPPEAPQDPGQKDGNH